MAQHGLSLQEVTIKQLKYYTMSKQILTIFLFAATILACNNSTSTEKTSTPFDEKAEQSAIMKVIDNETKCFFDGNYECWASNWSHGDYAMQTWNNDDGSIDAAIGWDSINAQGKNWIEKYYQNGKNVIHPVFKRDKMITKFFNDSTAHLIWTQYNADKEKTYWRISRESRIMEKKADGWKIVNVTALWDYGKGHDVPFDSLKIN
jgi:hypothetical protein